MWVIFLASSIAVALAAMFVVWIGNKVYLSIKRQNRNFENEEKENKKDEK